MKIELKYMNPGQGADSDELSRVILARFGLMPRKKDAKAGFHRLLLEMYEKKKAANNDKKPELAVMTVEEMGAISGIKRQTMYDYLRRWTSLQILKKTSFVNNGAVVAGYELNGTNLENAFRKAESIVHEHINKSIEIVKELQNEVKKEKLRKKNDRNEENERPELQEQELAEENIAAEMEESEESAKAD
jgi:hypothetical protein